MNEKGLIEQVLRIINKNYSNIYVVDIPNDKVYSFDFSVSNDLFIKDVITYTSFIEISSNFIHKDELSDYFNALSISKLEEEANRGNPETKVKYRKLCEAGEYRWFVNIINYLPFENSKLIFMMSEDINDRLVDVEKENIQLSSQIDGYKERLDKENASIGNAIYQINSLLDNGKIANSDTKNYINTIFNNVSNEHPELNKAITEKIVSTNNYRKPSILIIDDSSIIRNSLKRIFVNNFEILMAKDGNEAIDILTKNLITGYRNDPSENIVGVLLDLIMPDADGFVVLDFMKRFDLFSKVPVAIISGDESVSTRKRVYEYDIVDMLEKPFNTDNIRRRISKIINLYMSSNNLENIIERQQHQITNAQNDKKILDLKYIINQIVETVLNNAESMRLKGLARIVVNDLMNNHPEYGINEEFAENIINSCPLYNVGSLALSNKDRINNDSIKQVINYSITIIDNYIVNEHAKTVANNIAKFSCEMYDGTGYPNGLIGSSIPVEAQIVNVMVRINQQCKLRSFNQVYKNLMSDYQKYNEHILESIERCKKQISTLYK